LLKGWNSLYLRIIELFFSINELVANADYGPFTDNEIL